MDSSRYKLGAAVGSNAQGGRIHFENAEILVKNTFRVFNPVLKNSKAPLSSHSTDWNKEACWQKCNGCADKMAYSGCLILAIITVFPSWNSTEANAVARGQ